MCNVLSWITKVFSIIRYNLWYYFLKTFVNIPSFAGRKTFNEDEVVEFFGQTVGGQSEKLKKGDIIFRKTPNYLYTNVADIYFTHSAMVSEVKEDDILETKVYHSTYGGVAQLTLKDLFFEDGEAETIAWVRPNYVENQIDDVLKYCESKEGIEYDANLDPSDNTRLYCVELLVKALRSADVPTLDGTIPEINDPLYNFYAPDEEEKKVGLISITSKTDEFEKELKDTIARVMSRETTRLKEE